MGLISRFLEKRFQKKFKAGTLDKLAADDWMNGKAVRNKPFTKEERARESIEFITKMGTDKNKMKVYKKLLKYDDNFIFACSEFAKEIDELLCKYYKVDEENEEDENITCEDYVYFMDEEYKVTYSNLDETITFKNDYSESEPIKLGVVTFLSDIKFFDSSYTIEDYYIYKFLMSVKEEID